MTRRRKLYALNSDGQFHCCRGVGLARAFSVIEAIVMLVVLAIFTLIVIALLIREAGTARDEIQQETSTSPGESASGEVLDFYLG